MRTDLGHSTPRTASTQRLITLIASLVVSLGSGTNYVYSAYAPQLGSQLNISHTRLNIIGLAGNVGVYSTAPILGRLVDHKGPKLILAASFLCLLIGYSGIRHFYNSADSFKLSGSPSVAISTFNFCVLVFFSYLTGVGGNGGLVCGMNATANSFPDRLRASATGLVISGFGLSAFFFSTIAQVFVPGDTSSLLLILALGTSLPMIAGLFLIKVVPLPASEDHQSSRQRSRTPVTRRSGEALTPTGSDGMLRGDAVAYDHLNDSHTRLLADDEEGVNSGFPSNESTALVSRSHSVDSIELSVPPPSAISRRRSISISRAGHSRNNSLVVEVVRDLRGKALLKSGDFWLLFVILSLLSGTGLMYINNVGSISQALFAQGNPNYDTVEAAKWQSMQVSTISVANCLGRIILGLGADIVKNQLNAPRSFCISAVAVLFLASQLLALQVDDIAGLWKASTMLGLAYGGLFGLCPVITIEWFGLSHFSENWGYLAFSPMLGGNLFSMAFGRNIDQHAASGLPTQPPAARSVVSRAGVSSSQQCFDGQRCYVDSLYMTILACIVALLLSLFAGWRDRKRMVVSTKPGEPEDIIWEENDRL